jgi:hypothetical protein
MTDHALSAGRAFIDREGRLIERRLAAAIFDGADASGAMDAVLAYRNPDGGFGHGLEPDKRCPASLALDVETALDVMLTAQSAAGDRLRSTSGLDVEAVARAACDWLGSVATADGAVSLLSPVIEAYPRAVHLTDWTYLPALNPTAGLAGRLHRLGITHPWVDLATEWCWNRLETASFDEDAHAVSEVAIFLANVPERARAEQVAENVGDWLAKAQWYRADPDDPEYGVTPLYIAPTPDSPWRSLFDESTIEGHLDRLTRDQQPDGGWAITWEPPGTAATLEWRGVQTLNALRTLRAYGRL